MYIVHLYYDWKGPGILEQEEKHAKDSKPPLHSHLEPCSQNFSKVDWLVIQMWSTQAAKALRRRPHDKTFAPIAVSSSLSLANLGHFRWKLEDMLKCFTTLDADCRCRIWRRLWWPKQFTLVGHSAIEYTIATPAHLINPKDPEVICLCWIRMTHIEPKFRRAQDWLSWDRYWD